jgi:hypothetical protein
MSVSSQLPATTSAASVMQQGGIKPPDISIPGMAAVTGGAQNYENRMAATQSLVQVGNGGLAGGGYRKKRKTIYKRRYNNVTKVMKGCNGKKTRRHKKNKRHNKRVFRGGSNISPNIIGGKVEVNVPLGATGGQIETLQTLTKGLMDVQTAAGNIPPPVPKISETNFSGGGMTRHRSTKYRRLRYKKSIGRRGRSRRHSGRH